MPISVGPDSYSSMQDITLKRRIDKIIEIEYGVILHYVLETQLKKCRRYIAI